MNLRSWPVGSRGPLLFFAGGLVVGLVLTACSGVPSPSTATSSQSVFAASVAPEPTVEIVGPPAIGVGPAANGLIAYSFDGDIFVGDPVTGASQVITSGPESDINPKFSPDGTHIAFVRGTPVRGPAGLIVVRADGSDERVVVPEEFTATPAGHLGHVGTFAWTPDGRGIVVQVDFPPTTYPHGDGELGLFDASGVREPRLLVPPLFAMIGGTYFNPSAQIAPMFRPPDGDLIVSQTGPFEVFDVNLTLAGRLDNEALAHYAPDGAFDPTWSPDGAAIVVSLLGWAEAAGGFSIQVWVLNAEGGDLHRLGPGAAPMWSPDGSSIAYEHFGPDWDAQALPAERRLAVYDVVSGTKRVLDSSVSSLKEGATVQTITNNPMHAWYWEGWSWSPDGRSILILKDHGTRPVVVDVETDTATELPWETDSFPSWQRAAVP